MLTQLLRENVGGNYESRSGYREGSAAACANARKKGRLSLALSLAGGKEGGRVFIVISQSQLDPLHPLPLDTRGELVGREQDYFDLNLGPMGASNGIKSVLHVLRAAIANRSNNEDACPLPPLFLHAEGGIID